MTTDTPDTASSTTGDDDTPDTPTVAVFGSVNLDRTRRVPDDEVAALDADPAVPPRGTTAPAESPPDDFDADAIRLGGKGANQAVAAARAGAATTLVGAVGSDATDHAVRETLVDEGVETALATRETETGAAFVWVTPDGDNRILVRPGANDTLDASDAERALAAAREADVVLLQNEVPVAAAEALLDALPSRSAGGEAADTTDTAAGQRPLVVVDPAPAPGAVPLVDHPRVDVFVPNETEFAGLCGPLAAARERGAVVVRTDGPDGATVFAGDDAATDDEVATDPLATPSFRVSAPSAPVVDTTGAGDAFAGYFAATLAAAETRTVADTTTARGRIGTATLRAAVERGVRAGTLSCAEAGAMTAPRAADVDDAPDGDARGDGTHRDATDESP
ncbi:PfkB family carbohydrate kinase [Halobaculum sp. MBLA0147]|uniref:PfkB family carbohydrate kinase n=1 Tax=Halobaculum sp. MBLA0147 TaxID=3079934 RepID=UPI0035238855